MNVITAFFYYKVRQTVLQSGAALLLQSEAGSITKWSRYYKVGQVLLQSGAGITKWGIITKWCITALTVLCLFIRYASAIFYKRNNVIFMDTISQETCFLLFTFLI